MFLLVVSADRELDEVPLYGSKDLRRGRGKLSVKSCKTLLAVASAANSLGFARSYCSAFTAFRLRCAVSQRLDKCSPAIKERIGRAVDDVHPRYGIKDDVLLLPGSAAI